MTKIDLTPINFGKDSIKTLAPFLQKNDYKKAMLISGKGSIKNGSLYNDIVSELKTANIELVEFFGIKPNPTNTQINEASKLGIKEEVDIIIAAGGGSAIDAAKVIAAMISNPTIEDSWNCVTMKESFLIEPIDIVSIITLAGTASENNAGSVVTNESIPLKRSISTKSPILAIEDPEYTFSVSPWQTASGIFDAISHILEQYFTIKGSMVWTDNYNFSILKTLIQEGPKVLENPNNFDARSNILFSTSMALNGLSSLGATETDWTVHQMAHAIAGIYDTTHGATLALITPTYLLNRNEDKTFSMRLEKLGKEVFGVSTANETIDAIKTFIIKMNLPIKYSDFDELSKISDEDINAFVKDTNDLGRITKTQISKIFNSIKR